MCVKKIKSKLCCAACETIANSDVTMKFANKTDHITCVKQHQSFYDAHDDYTPIKNVWGLALTYCLFRRQLV